jgi:hypothetical protein
MKTLFHCICIRDFDSKKILNSNKKWYCRMAYPQNTKKGELLQYNKKAYHFHRNADGSFVVNLKANNILVSTYKSIVEKIPLHLLYVNGRPSQTFFDPFLFKHYFKHLSEEEYKKLLAYDRFDL